jgi:hypothetical protein
MRLLTAIHRPSQLIMLMPVLGHPGRTRVSTEPTTSGIQKVSLLFREEYGFYRLDTYLDEHYM